MITPLPSIEITVGAKPLTLVWNGTARYRLSSLGDVTPGAFASMINIIWAADTTRSFSSPLSVAEALTEPQEQPALDAVEKIMAAADPEKKSSSVTGPLPATTSASQPLNGSPSTTTPSAPSPSDTSKS